MRKKNRAKVVTSKNKHRIISKEQLQTTIRRKGQQPISNSFTIQNPQACHLLSQLGGGAPFIFISIHENDKFYFDYFEKNRLNGENTEEGNVNFNDKDQTWDNAS